MLRERSRDAGGGDTSATRGALNLAGGQATCADLDLRDFAIDQDAGDLKVRLPGAARFVVGMRHVVAEGDSLLAGVTDIAGDWCHGLAQNQFDTRHFGAVTLAVTGLQNASVSAGARGELWADLLEQLV